MNTWHKPARAPHAESYQRPATSDQEARQHQNRSTFTLCTNSAHPYQNKGFVSNLFSHACAHLRLYPLCFDMLHKNTRGWVVTSVATVPSRIGMTEKHGSRNPRTGLPPAVGRRDDGGKAGEEREFGGLFFGGGFMSDMNVRPPSRLLKKLGGG